MYPPTQSVNTQAFRYYDLTVSVGLVSDNAAPTIEIQEFQPLVEAPQPATLTSVTLYGRALLPAGQGIYSATLHRTLAITAAQAWQRLRYMEV